MLKLIKMWLKVPVEERDHRGRPHRSNPARRTGRGTPQGAPLSPLLSNIYMRRFVLGWKQLGYEQKLQARIVNYADDFVVCCRGTADEAMQVTRRIMQKLKLTINEQKTVIRYLPEESIEFLGYEIGRCYSTRNGRSYLGTKPSRKRIRRVYHRISELTRRTTGLTPVEDRVLKLNQVMRGWANYFCLGPVSKAYHNVDAHARYRLREWLRHKHKVKGRGTARYPDEYLYGTLGLVRLEQTTRNFPWAKA
jgi:hypothetical protein